MVDMSSLDIAFALFLATVKPADFSPDEWSIYQYHRMHRQVS